MSNFRSKVEEIQCDLCNWKEDGCDYLKESQLCPVVRVTTDRICTALKERVEGMPRLHTSGVTDWEVGVGHGGMCQYNSDKSYLMKEVE
jgi:hypothetical protein